MRRLTGSANANCWATLPTFSSPLVFALERYSQSEFTRITFALLLYWISHVWLTAHRGRMTDDPLVFAIKDRLSQILITLMGVAAWLAV